ncbi:MAG TPA: ATP-grasp domain-containing protein [Ramlibacter sp.]|uniref:ATP-grasp domain-containing protein n=1 Tax=Ramlibacter sp. TaxID=1917967 RepID=UPI002ED07B48
MADAVVVAGLWVRPLAESACQAGWRVMALDLFGDADTRRASARWMRIGDPASFAIAPALLGDALQRAAREPGVTGWIAGSGFEAWPDALALHVPGLPLLGMAAAAVRRVRDPASFFATLDRLRLEHPEVSLRAPGDPEGWLVKSGAGAGGWHIRHARDAGVPAGPSIYWQRFQAGEAMSALFLADGARARLVALNRLLVRPLGALPFVYHGAIGPIRDGVLTRRLQQMLAVLVPAFGLRGLASLDFIARDGRVSLLEVNPRPSATMVLHAQAWPGGLLRAHVRAVQGELPDAPASHAAGVRGCLTLFADRACSVDAALAAELATSPFCHDLPAPGSTFGAGEPVCSVSAEAAGTQAVLGELAVRAERVRERLTSCEELAA